MSTTIGGYLAKRLAQIGVSHHFAVAGDYNLVLLDQLLAQDGLEQVYCCNELNCGFAAEGYARARGAACAVVTFSVGALSAINALGGAHAENLPVILVSGAPNTNDHGTGRILHHTLGTSDYGYQYEMVRHVTVAAERLFSAEDAPAKIDRVIERALALSKPVYLEIPCNVADLECPEPGPVEALLSRRPSAGKTLDRAIETTLNFLNEREQVVILIGSKLRAAHGLDAAVKLADRVGCAVTIMAAAKGFFPEDHPAYRGVYWGNVSSPGAEELIDNADAILCLGPVFNDYSTVGWQAWPKGDKMVRVEPEEVIVAGRSFGGISLFDFVTALSEQAPRRTRSAETPALPAPETAPLPASAPLTNDEMMRQIGALVTADTTLTAETGDSWFNAVRLTLPAEARVELEMQWGHIGWSVPSAFGNATGSPERQHIVMVGDGSFQLTAQEVAQMIRYELPVMIFLVNNRGYVIEIKIHDGPYNYIKNWNYAGLIDVFNAGEGHGLGLKAHTSGELAEAIAKARQNRRGPTLIECSLDREDCTEDLVRWGSKVGKTNARPPVTN
ncbi:thiamine pyrophosphate-binding protein [Asaia sp. BMEF1]|uniref:alpha-keto acid decarboxylase family protein n=1 Tax=Asaia sp. BMEF1 TaxID=3155932 RepID=UPI003F66AE08